MSKIIFTEEFCKPENLHPFTLTRQIQDLRIGILTIREKWEQGLKMTSYDKFEDDYKDLEKCIRIDDSLVNDTYYLIHGNLLPTPNLVKAVKSLKAGQFISLNEGQGVVYCFTKNEVKEYHKIEVNKAIPVKDEAISIQFPWDIFQKNAEAIRLDFQLVTNKRKSASLSRTNKLLNPKKIFIEKGVIAEHVVINATEGPVYIGRDVRLMEGTIIRGPVSVGQGSVLKMGARIYGASTIGPGCVVGGEIKNSVIFSNSNKAHDGYLGDAVIGEWCNLGAGTSNSNMKNNAGTIRIWTSDGYLEAGKKCGVLMGDYTKTAINTSINTGTVIGVCCNVFGNGLTPKFIPNFSWGSEGVKRYEFEKAIEDIKNWKSLKQQNISVNELSILKFIFENY
ncbi:MAG: glucose-1-phosphate thymidylyltransferase [Chitinophagaceae bacterium]|jgi:UDP-N-acetylglucosamine diphosphorylase/glucosamine-1-phosphate N-acetyltransferase|nr:glucose-1-phosphate thymidylyltransferase [Chitinophagaceae bacterium]